ncbi:hypothetical protein C8Q75DRAFT_79450 [Abortiporus biennis]|nr:hypothetical protein C8Q75DRAFT_79450 [Abortiporus biennis]
MFSIKLSSAFFVALFALIAGQALALNVTLGTTSVQPAQVIVNPDAQLTSACQASCAPATQSLQACTDDACFCSNATFAVIRDCEQCYFNELISTFKESVDPTRDPSAVLTAYKTACTTIGQIPLANLTAVTLPSNWNGPFGQGLNLGATVVTVIAAFGLGSGLIYTVCTM